MKVFFLGGGGESSREDAFVYGRRPIFASQDDSLSHAVIRVMLQKCLIFQHIQWYKIFWLQTLKILKINNCLNFLCQPCNKLDIWQTFFNQWSPRKSSGKRSVVFRLLQNLFINTGSCDNSIRKKGVSRENKDYNSRRKYSDNKQDLFMSEVENPCRVAHLYVFLICGG